MTSEKGSRWLEEAVLSDGYLNLSGCEYSFHSVEEVIKKLGALYSHDRLIAKLSFGFWTYQFAAKEFAASGSTLLNIFSCRPFGTKQKDVFKTLIRINDLRNRIAHYEPICFEGNSVSIIRTQKRYEDILELLRWLGSNPQKILYGLDGVRKAIHTIDCS